jgi:membrane-associated phospholipid phosphatase
VRVEGPLLVFAAILAAVTTDPALDGVPELERRIFESVNGFPGWLEGPVQVVMAVGLLVAVPIVAAVAFALRHPRAGTAIAIAGIGAYVVVRIVKHLVTRGRPLDVFGNADVIVHGDVQGGLGFPSGHAAVSMAIVCAAIPFLRGRWRWALLAVPAGVAFGRVYVGAHLPLDVVGGAAMGLAIATAYHLFISRPAVRGADVEEPEVTPEPALGGPEDQRARTR